MDIEQLKDKILRQMIEVEIKRIVVETITMNEFNFRTLSLPDYNLWGAKVIINNSLSNDEIKINENQL